MRSLIQVDHVQKYANSKIGNAWPISNLFLDPLPILAIRNQNDYDKHYTPKDRHSTFSWKRNWYLKYALEVAIPLLVRWQALRTGRKGIQDRLKSDLKDKAPNILLRFQNHARDLAIRRLSDVKPNQRYYGDFLLAVSNAVHEVSELKKVKAPMIGSKFMHFFMPELFPVWDTKVIRDECLKHEEPPSLPVGVKDKIRKGAGESYAQYVHFLVTELSQASTEQRSEVLRVCIQRCADEYDADVNEMNEVLFSLRRFMADCIGNLPNR